MEGAYHQWVHAGGVDRLALRDSHRAESPSVVRALHANDILPFCEPARHLDCGLNSLGARVPEEERVQRGIGHHREQALDKPQVRLVERNAALFRNIFISELIKRKVI